MSLITPKYFTLIYFEDYQKPTSFNGLIDLVWNTMCENHPYGNYFLGKDQDQEARFKRDIFPPYFKPLKSFDVNNISLNDVLFIHENLFEFFSKVKADEQKQWRAFVKKRAALNESQSQIINAYHGNTGIPKNSIRQRLKRDPDSKAKVKK
jgi:hypothetical protein